MFNLSFMASAANAFKAYSDTQKREINFAIIAVALGSEIRRVGPEFLSVVKSVAKRKADMLSTKGSRTESEDKALQLLFEIGNISPSLDGLRKFDELRRKVDVAMAMDLLRECLPLFPSILKDPSFGVFLKKPESVYRFAEFMSGWHYSGDGYSKPPKGFGEPFPGFDDIVNALMGHSRCRTEAAKQASAWEKYQASLKKAA